MVLLHYFLGVEVIPTTIGLFLPQHKYVHDILENQNMAGAKDISTPLSTTQSLHLLDGTTSVDNTEYRRIIGSLQNQNMAGAKDISTPLSTTQSLHLLDGTTSVDNTEYRHIIGSLQYLSLTRLDICFAVNKLSQFMHKPTVTH
jgi:hypothetical protein